MSDLEEVIDSEFMVALYKGDRRVNLPIGVFIEHIVQFVTQDCVEDIKGEVVEAIKREYLDND